MAGLCFCLFALVLFFPLPFDQIGGGFLVCSFFLSFSSFICFFGCSDGMEREACVVCDHGFERSDLCAEIIIIIIIITPLWGSSFHRPLGWTLSNPSSFANLFLVEIKQRWEK